MSEAKPGSVDPASTYVWVWAALLVLLGTTIVAAHFLDGAVGTATGLAIATAKGLLVVWFFLHLKHHHGISRVAACFAILWLSLMMILTLTDYLTR